MAQNRILNIGIDGTPLLREVDGVGRYTQQLLLSLLEISNAELTILAFADEKKKQTLLTQSSRVHNHYFPIPRKPYQASFSRLAAMPIDSLAAGCNFDVIFSPNFTLFPYIKTRPSAILVHDTAFADAPQYLNDANRRYLARRVPWSIDRTDLVFTNSTFTRNRLLELYDVNPSKVKILPGGVDSRFFHAATHQTNAAVRKKYALGEKYILFTGTLQPRKNVITLIKAYASLPSSIQTDYQLVLCGAKGWKNAELDSYLAANPNLNKHVNFTGYINDEDLPVIFQQASLFVFPSLYEGVGLPVIEAMAAGTPVISSALAPLKSIAGDTIRYTNNPMDADELRKRMLTILGSTKSVASIMTVGARGVAEKYNWSSGAQVLLEELGSIVAKGRKL